MSFDVTAAANAAFMGRWSQPLAVGFADLARVRRGQRVLDVGCGPGALTEQLVARVGAAAVAAIDPSPSFVAAARERFPDADVRAGTAEQLPFLDGTFDATIAQLVVHFMADPGRGLAEMARVTRPGGLVAACVWDHAGDGGPLSLFWRAVHDVDPGAGDESGLAGSREGHLAQLCHSAGLLDVASSTLTVRVGFATVEQWWEPFTLGVGPAGAYVAGLAPAARTSLATRCAQLLPDPPFEVTASAWAVTARV